MNARCAAPITLAVYAAIACGNPSTTVKVSPAVTPPELDRAKLDHVSLLLRGHPVADAEWERWVTQSTAAADIADEMLTDPFLAQQIAPALLFRNNFIRRGRAQVLKAYDLKSMQIAGTTVLSITGPCLPADIATVRPWWDPTRTVSVCKESIRAAVWETPLDGRNQTCNSNRTSPKLLRGTKCGCGPNLLRCQLPEYEQELVLAAGEELRATTAYVVDRNEPLARLFLMNETWRNRTIELFYLRNIVESRRIADPESAFAAVAAWPADGKVAPREEVEIGQHAGVLTTPQIIYHVFDPRQRMRIIYEGIWCAGESAPGALPEDVLTLHTPNLSVSNEGWQELAARPFCTNCHARLDYGMQFFRGYRAPLEVSFHYIMGETNGATGPLYGEGISDLRGTAALTPHGFAELATRQPEFAQCMAEDVAEYVFGARTATETIDRLARSAAPQELRLRDMMRLAVLEFLQCSACKSPGTDLVRTHSAPTAAPIALSEMAEKHCTGCHHEGASIPDFEGTLDRSTQIRMMDQVLFGRMPPTGPLPPEVRHRFVMGVLGGGQPGSLRGSSLLRAHADPPRALPLLVAREHLRELGGGHAGMSDLNTMESALSGRDNLLTPNHLMFTAIEAYDSCRNREHDRRNCVDSALDPIWGSARTGGARNAP